MVPKLDYERSYGSKAQHLLRCMPALRPLLRQAIGRDMVQRQGRNQCQITKRNNHQRKLPQGSHLRREDYSGYNLIVALWLL